MRIGDQMGIPNRSIEQSLDVISGWDQEEDITIADLSGNLNLLSGNLPNGIGRDKYVCLGFSNEGDAAGVVTYNIDETDDSTNRQKGLNQYDRHWLGPVIKTIIKAQTTCTKIKLYYKDRNVYNGKSGHQIDLS